MAEIDRTLYKALDPLSIASQLNLIAYKHTSCGNKVKRGPLGMVRVIFTNGEAHYFPSERGIELSIIKYDEQNLCKLHNKNLNK